MSEPLHIVFAARPGQQKPSLRERLTELLVEHRVKLPDLPQRLGPRITEDDWKVQRVWRASMRKLERLQ